MDKFINWQFHALFFVYAHYFHSILWFWDIRVGDKNLKS